MGYHPRIETADKGSFLTTRSRNSELWFANNKPLEYAVLAYAAKYTTWYGVKLYALAIEGNHIQGTADFPNFNRAPFMRVFNSTVARAVPRCTPSYPGGKFWGRRYSQEFLPGGPDIEDRFFYTVLQAVQDGLVEKISEFPGYNCFHDAVWGITRKYKAVRWGEYNAAKKRNRKREISIADYTDEFELKYERLPGYEHMSQKQYAILMNKKLEERRQRLVAERKAKGLGFAGREALLKIRCGSLPHSTKTSDAASRRPRVLCVCPERRQEALTWYFGIYAHYKDSSKRYRSGDRSVDFPIGTYHPPPICNAVQQ